MANPHVIAPPVRSTPGPQRQQRAIPSDLLRGASRRLGIISLLGATIWLVGTVTDRLALRAISHGDPGWARLQASDAICAVSVVVSLALFLVTRRRERDPQFLLDLGLGYMVFTGLAVGLGFHWDAPPTHGLVWPVITWNGTVTLIFAAIVPNTPRKTLIAGSSPVSMNPLSMLIAQARRGVGLRSHEQRAADALSRLPARGDLGGHLACRYGLGQQVAKAREMGSYQLGELLGRGGMGEVYRATHRMLARPAAIKLIRPEMIGAREPARPRSSRCAVPPRGRNASPACGRRTRSSSTTSG